MATTQEALDLKYDLLKMESEKKLNEYFSGTILSVMRNQQNLNTFEEIQSFTGSLELANAGLSEANGLEYFKNATGLFLYSNDFNGNSIDVSAMSSLRSIYCYGMNINGIGNISQLFDLLNVNVAGNSITSVGRLNDLVNLQTVVLNNNQISDVGNVSGLIALRQFTVANNNLSSTTVSNLLSNLRQAFDGGATFTSGIVLSGNAAPTNGNSNADYLYLIGQGITVTIDTV